MRTITDKSSILNSITRQKNSALKTFDYLLSGFANCCDAASYEYATLLQKA